MSVEELSIRYGQALQRLAELEQKVYTEANYAHRGVTWRVENALSYLLSVIKPVHDDFTTTEENGDGEKQNIIEREMFLNKMNDKFEVAETSTISYGSFWEELHGNVSSRALRIRLDSPIAQVDTLRNSTIAPLKNAIESSMNEAERRRQDTERESQDLVRQIQQGQGDYQRIQDEIRKYEDILHSSIGNPAMIGSPFMWVSNILI